MSWSLKITILYLGFIALILTLVFTCFGHKTELEYKDYYSRELSFQQQLTAQQNLSDLSEPITYELRNGEVVLHFPGALISGLRGHIEFMRPSDASKDLTVAAAPAPDGSQTIGGLHKGVYKMRIRIKHDGKDYFKEAVLTLR